MGVNHEGQKINWPHKTYICCIYLRLSFLPVSQMKIVAQMCLFSKSNPSNKIYIWVFHKYLCTIFQIISYVNVNCVIQTLAANVISSWHHKHSVFGLWWTCNLTKMQPRAADFFLSEPGFKIQWQAVYSLIHIESFTKPHETYISLALWSA